MRPTGSIRPHHQLRTLVILQLLILMFSLNSAPVSASRGGVYHQVASGETLDILAQKYRIPIYEIAKANRVKINDRIHPGSRLYIPGGKAVAATQTRTQPSTPAATPKPAPRSASPRSATINRPTSNSGSAAPPFAGANPVVASAPPARPTRSQTIKVRSGDTLWGIANRYDLTVDQLASANNLNPRKALHVGKELTIPGRGSTSSPSSSSSSSSSRSTPAPSLENTGSTRAISSRGYSWPVQGKLLRHFEDNTRTKHFGIDIEVPYGTNLQATRSGKVVYVGKIPAYGRMVIVNHSGGVASCYAFCSDILVREGQSVSRGDVIARSGDPERSDKPYFHFQLRKGGDAINPLPYLP